MVKAIRIVKRRKFKNGTELILLRGDKVHDTPLYRLRNRFGLPKRVTFGTSKPGEVVLRIPPKVVRRR